MNSFITRTLKDRYKNTGILFLALYSMHSPAEAAVMKIDNGFESGNLTGLQCSGNCPTVVTAPAATPKFAGNFDLTRSMATPYRTEVQAGDKAKFLFGEEYWFGFNYRYEEWAKDSSADIAPFQIHTTPSSWTNASCSTGAAIGSAPFLMLTQNDESRLITYGGKILWRGAVQKKQWLGITVHFKISTGADGYIEAWKDGVKLGRVDGPNSQKLDGCGQPVKEPFFKMGVYKWDWKAGRPATQSTRRQLFIDNLKIAQGANAYSMVSSTPPKPIIDQDTTPPVISNVQASVTETTAVVTWNTNETADSLIRYGLTTGYGLSATNGLAVTTHSVSLKDLKAGSLYHYRVSSKDASGNVGSSTDLTFATDKPANAGLVAYWPLDPVAGSTLPDLSGNGHAAALVNGALVTATGGVKFDGLNDYVNAGKFDVPGNAITVSAWVWTDNLTNCAAGDCRIISKATSAAEQDHYFMISPVKVGTAMRLRFRLKTNGVTSTLVAASGPLASKTWFHVAAVYNGSTMRLYKDGVEVGSMAKSGSLTTNGAAPIWLGGNPPSATSRPWKGQIDDVSIYSYALTPAEIAQLAQ